MESLPDPQELAEELRLAIGEFVRAARRHDVLGSAQASVLGHLARSGARSITDLATLEQVRHQSMARTVKALESEGWVSLVADPQDGRRVIVGLTVAGTTRLAEERLRRTDWIAAAMALHLTAPEQTELARLVALLRRLSSAEVPQATPD